MYILDAVIIVLLITGAMAGMRRGFFKQTVLLIGLVVCLVLAFYLRTPIATFMYKVLPFFNFAGVFHGVAIINILVYEVIAFLIIFSVLYLVLRLILKLTGLIEGVLKATVILGFFSKIGGAIVGVIESYVIIFILIFLFNQPFLTIRGLEESWLSKRVLDSTPIMSDAIKDTRDAITELYTISERHKDNSEEFNKEAIQLFLKYDIISQKNVDLLKEKGKI
ncbi:MAG: CvpA family protein [Tenericutes bacterium]|nr:CvpA family protein [Mycoplasmatota bacterium]